MTKTLKNTSENKKFNIFVPKSYDDFKSINLDNYSAIYIGGGSIRIHNQGVQQKMFEALELTKE